MEIKLLNKKEIFGINRLLSDYRFNEFRAYRALDKDKLKNYLFYKINNVLKDKNSKMAIVRKSGEIMGLATLEFLPWDTKHFGIKMAKIGYLMANGDYGQSLDTKNKLLSYLFTLCKKERIVHLSCRIDINDISSIHALEMNGFRLMDTLVTFAFIRNKHKIPNIRTIYPVRKCKKSDIPYLMDIARKSFVDDRFHLDPNIPKEKADSLYSKWVRNSWLRKETIFVATRKNQPIGFLTYRLYSDLVKIVNFKIMGQGLMAVKFEAKGALISLMQATFRDVNLHYDCVEYDTRITNYEVLQICQRLGLDFVRAKYTFHKCLNERV